jgi:hypothetical protein
VAGLDSLTQFYPWYELVGTTLRAGHLPGWNPYSLGGAPLAGNPLSGWAYLPAMVAFALLPLTGAVVAYQLFHVLLATLATYVLARSLGLRTAGALLAAVAYGQSGLISAEAACCFAFASIGAWLPVLLLGAELAIRAGGWESRLRGWSLAALAMSQILAAWLGQGSYYALLVFASFVTFRVVVRPMSGIPECRRGWRRQAIQRVGRLALQLTVPVVLGTGLAAAGLLPRVELNLLSSLAGGYAAEDQQVGGWTPAEWSALIEPGYWYAGLTVVGLASLAPWLAHRTPLVWYLLALGTTLLLLAMPGPSPVHALFGVLPGFSRLHLHLPDRIITVFLLVPALVAGITLDALARAPRAGPIVAILAVGACFADLRVAREWTFAGYAQAEGVHRLFPVDLDAYYTPMPAARFLQAQMRATGPFRYLGYGSDPGGLAYTQRFTDPDTLLLGVNNRAVSDRLLDVQGYDAVHLARFDAYLQSANGRAQNYHNADLFADGLRSPLLDLLAARYVVMPSGDGSPLGGERLATVYDNGLTRVLEKREALPWAWIVHDWRAASAEEARAALHAGRVDPRRTALLEPPLRSPLDPWEIASHLAGTNVGPPATALPPAPARDRITAGPAQAEAASVLAFDADRLLVRAHADADAILVLAEVAYPGWQATVDGRPVPIYVADGLLRAVALPAGDHLVELRFVSPALRIGLVISVATVIALAGCALAPLVRRRHQAPVADHIRPIGRVARRWLPHATPASRRSCIPGCLPADSPMPCKSPPG